MKTTHLLSAVIGLIVLGSASAADKPVPPVEVTFVHPEKFTDAKDDSFDSDRGRDYVLGQLREDLEKNSPKYLASGQHLEIKVTDVDLAGEYEPQRGPNFANIRIMRDIYPPRMNLEFKLTNADGKVVSEGKRHLVQQYYLMNAMMPSNEPLRYDKALINDWLQGEFKRSS